MKTLQVALGVRSYPIHIGAGLLAQSELLLPYIKNKRAIVVSNDVVAPLYLEALLSSLAENNIEVSALVLPDGENHKTAKTLESIYDYLLSIRAERSTTLIALGGGVTGDVAGYAAATYQRGMPFIQVPTTLLSQVDSSVGGKTGINHPLGKNMIGAFCQPKAVLADLAVLATLPAREISAGLAEVIKYGLIYDATFFAWLEQHMVALRAGDIDLLQQAVLRSCEIKAEIVAKDETEQNVRAWLNLGHTFGHAIEAGMGFGVWLHGEAVAAGTLMALELSHNLAWLDASVVARAEALFIAAGLPVRGPNLKAGHYLELMRHDKKVEQGQLRLVLLTALGQATVFAEATDEQIITAIESRLEG